MTKNYWFGCDTDSERKMVDFDGTGRGRHLSMKPRLWWWDECDLLALRHTVLYLTTDCEMPYIELEQGIVQFGLVDVCPEWWIFGCYWVPPPHGVDAAVPISGCVWPFEVLISNLSRGILAMYLWSKQEFVLWRRAECISRCMKREIDRSC